MMTKHKFRRRLIASAVASCTLAGMASFANAQQDETLLEEVIVTGIRASIERSMDIKRETSGVVDAISAEDIGKFPDTNLAESLQRITGVSINRENGEGSKVTVRGLGPDFNLVTLNGRQMPGATIGATYASGSRSFDFSNLASESVQAVEVYKTSRASAPSGGMGATINIVTPRPLEAGPKASIGVKGVWDDSSESSELTPEISGIYSDTFADGKFGVAVTASYQDRKGGSASATTGAGWSHVRGSVDQNWDGEEGVDFAWGGLDMNGNIRNQPADADVYGIPQQVGYTFGEFERERTNGQLTLQFAPTDDLTATLDYTYSSQKVEQKYHDLGAWFGWGAQSAIFTDNESPAVQTPLLYSEAGDGGDLTMGSGVEKTKAENKSIGFNIEWQPIDQLSLSLDAHSSEATLDPDSPYGNSVGVSVTSFSRDRTTINTRGEVPGLILDLSNSEGGYDILLEDLQASGSWFRESHSKHSVDQVQIDGNWEFNDQWNIDFGYAWTEGEFNSGYSDNSRQDGWGGLGEPGELPAEFFSKKTILDRFSGSLGQTSQEEMGFLGGTNTEVINQRFETDFYGLRDYYAANFDNGEGRANCADGSTYYCSAEPDTFQQIIETTNSAYVQVNYNTELAGMGFSANAGLRYLETDVEAPYTGFDYQPIRWVAGNEFSMNIVEGSAHTISDTGSYDMTLPSLDLRLDVTDDITVRTSYGKSIARPDWLSLRGIQYGNVRVQGAEGSAGNPSLKPYESDNFDLSVEWYYGDASYASLGYFRKKVSQFISSTKDDRDGPANTALPSRGKRAQAAFDAGIGKTDSEAIRDFIYENFPDPQTAYKNESGNIVIVGIPGEDPDVGVEVSTSFNSDREVTIDGLEANIQHTFWDTGFGVIANYTVVDENVGYDVLDIGAVQTPVTGLSDSANLIGFYEKDGFQARIAYNWRDSFLAATAWGTDGSSGPLYVDSYSQVDVNVSYELTDNLSVFLEGINITEQSGRNYGASERAVAGWYEGYARYNIGARYTF